MSEGGLYVKMKRRIAELEAQVKLLAENSRTGERLWEYAVAENAKLKTLAQAGLESCKTTVTFGGFSYYTYPSEELCELAALLESE